MVLNPLAWIMYVASLADAWIETVSVLKCPHECESRPSRTRGLKLPWNLTLRPGGVASLADAWIETRITSSSRRSSRVASLADAWIET